MGKKYFGKNAFLNMLVSRAIFAALRYRRWSLQREFAKRKPISLVAEQAESKAELQRFLQAGFTKLNIGGGEKNLSGFINIDFVRHHQVARQVVANFLNLSFIPDEAVTHVHSCHALEHINQQQLVAQIQEYWRILKPNGLLSIRCPNALGVAYGFFFGQVKEEEQEEFVRLGYPPDEDFYNPSDGWYFQDLWGLYHWWYGYTGSVVNEHFNLITPSNIIQLLKQTGFKIQKITNPETSNIILLANKEKRLVSKELG